MALIKNLDSYPMYLKYQPYKNNVSIQLTSILIYALKNMYFLPQRSDCGVASSVREPDNPLQDFDPVDRALCPVWDDYS